MFLIFFTECLKIGKKTEDLKKMIFRVIVLIKAISIMVIFVFLFPLHMRAPFSKLYNGLRLTF